MFCDCGWLWIQLPGLWVRYIGCCYLSQSKKSCARAEMPSLTLYFTLRALLAMIIKFVAFVNMISFQVARTMLREEGMKSFYKGLGPSLLGIAPYIALNFCVFDL